MCIASPPQYGVLELENNDGKIIKREVFGKNEINCPYCHKPWSEHEGYTKKPKEFDLT